MGGCVCEIYEGMTQNYFLINLEATTRLVNLLSSASAETHYSSTHLVADSRFDEEQLDIRLFLGTIS